MTGATHAPPDPRPATAAEAVIAPDPALLERLVSAPAGGGAYFQLLQQARQFHEQGAWRESADAHCRLVAAYPWNVEIWKRLAVARYNSGDFPVRLGEIDLESAVELAKEQDIYAYDAYVLECARKYRTPIFRSTVPSDRSLGSWALRSWRCSS